MMGWKSTKTPAAAEAGQERRRHGRLKTDGTESSLGEVVDMSASGMRVVRKGALPISEGESFRIDLQVGKEIMEVDVNVRRVRKLGRRKFEFGLEFINLEDADKIKLGRLARVAATAARAMW